MDATQKIIECVPNFSEGRDMKIIGSIVSTIEKIKDVKLLHVDSGYDANRTVITFAGFPGAVVEAAFQAIKTASQLIEMRNHTGIHPRFGAVDVCPLIPLNNMSMDEVINLSKELGKRVGEELDIPVYLYENSAAQVNRKSLAYLRSGGYEAIPSKITLDEWKPDFGPTKFNEHFGNIAIGARNFLIAYNVNLKSKDLDLARKIASEVRTKRYNSVKYLTNNNCKALKAIGWEMPEYNCVQVSTNIIDFKLTGLHEAYESIKSTAKLFGVEVNGSELIGLVPLEALVSAGKYYRGGREKGNLSEIEFADLAVEKLGLSSLKPFELNNRVIDFLLK